MQRSIGIVLAALAGLALAGGAWAGLPEPAVTKAAPAKRAATRPPKPATAETKPTPSSFPDLKPLRIFSRNFSEKLEIDLYDEQGRVDESAACRLDAVLAASHADDDAPSDVRIDRRTLQLLFRAAYHFGAEQVEIISAYRKPGRRREGPHASGRAIDFKLPRVPAATLAAYLRTLPRVGVGVYTHPKTQYVHLDVRERSFHWLDASPPGRSWRERSIGSRKIAAVDASYTRDTDWPEGTRPPSLDSTR